MDQAVKCNAGHYMDEETSDLVEAMEDHRISPHSNSDSVVSKCQTICADKEPLGIWKSPNC